MDRRINDLERLFYKCKGACCGWIIKARETTVSNTIKIYQYSEVHSYHPVNNNLETRVKWIVNKFSELIKSFPSIDVFTLEALLWRDYMVIVP